MNPYENINLIRPRVQHDYRERKPDAALIGVKFSLSNAAYRLILNVEQAFSRRGR